jgi:hypothetical protein
VQEAALGGLVITTQMGTGQRVTATTGTAKGRVAVRLAVPLVEDGLSHAWLLRSHVVVRR